MPTTIQTKRGDSDYLNVHLLEDGELAIVRQWLIDGGPQDGEYTYFWGLRVGDGTNNGGQDGITSPLAAGMTNALMQASNAVRYAQIFNKDGNYQPQYLKWWNDLASASTSYITCIVPDPVSSNIHLGSGTLLYDGAIIDWSISDQFKMITDCTWDKSEWDYYHAGIDRITSYDLSEVTADSTSIDVIGIRESIQQQTASAYYANAKFIGIQSSIWNEPSATAMPVGIGFDAEYGFYEIGTTHGINQRVDTLIGYNISALENAAGETDYVGDLIGLNIEAQVANTFDGTFAGVKIGSIESIATSPIYGMLIGDLGEVVLAPYVAAMAASTISANNTDGIAHGIYINGLLAHTACGLVIDDVGDSSTTLAEGISLVAITADATAQGLVIEAVSGGAESRGIRIDDVSAASSTINQGIYMAAIGGTTTGISHAIKVGTVVSNSTDGTTVGYEISRLDGEVVRGIQLYTVGGSGTTESRGVVLNNVGITTIAPAAIATGYYADTIGNSDGGCALAHGLLINDILSDATAHGIEIGNVAADAESRGLTILTVGDVASVICEGINVLDVGSTSEVSTSCIGVGVDYVGSETYGTLSCFMRGFSCESDMTAHGIDLTQIYGGEVCRGIYIDSVDGVDATRNHGLTIRSVGTTRCTNYDSHAVGILLASVGRLNYSHIGVGLKVGTIYADETAVGVEVNNVYGDQARGVMVWDCGTYDSTQTHAFSAHNIGLLPNQNDIRNVGLNVDVIGQENSGAYSAGIYMSTINCDGTAHGIEFDTIAATVSRGLIIRNIGKSTSIHSQGIYVLDVGATLTGGVDRYALGFGANNIGSGSNSHSWGFKFDNISADGTAHGMQFNDITANDKIRGIVMYNLSSATATRCHGMFMEDIGSSITSTGNCGGILMSRIGNSGYGTFSYGARFLTISADGTAVGIEAGEISSAGKNVGFYGRSIGDTSSETVYGFEMVNFANASTHADDVVGLKFSGQVGNAAAQPYLAATSITRMISTDDDGVIYGDDEAAGIFINEVDSNTYSLGLGFGTIGNTNEDSATSRGINIDYVNASAQAIGIRLGDVYSSSTTITDVVAGLYIERVFAEGSVPQYAIYANADADVDSDAITTAQKGLTCLYLPESEPTGYEVGTLYTDASGNVKAVMA